MCQVDADGRWCVPSTSAAFEALDAEPDPARRVVLVQHHQQALTEHALTPDGWRELEAAIATVRREYRTNPAVTMGDEAGRQAYLSMLRLISLQALLLQDDQMTRAGKILPLGTGRPPHKN